MGSEGDVKGASRRWDSGSNYGEPTRQIGKRAKAGVDRTCPSTGDGSQSGSSDRRGAVGARRSGSPRDPRVRRETPAAFAAGVGPDQRKQHEFQATSPPSRLNSSPSGPSDKRYEVKEISQSLMWSH